MCMFYLDYFDVLPIIETLSLSYLQIKVGDFWKQYWERFQTIWKKG